MTSRRPSSSNVPVKLLGLAPDHVTPLPLKESFPEAAHQWSQEEIDALIFAVAARRPLLVRGEAGCGKSQLARAAAVEAGSGDLFVATVHPRFEVLDLLYSFDVVRRLADAQPGGEIDQTGERYLKKGALYRGIEAIKPDEGLPVVLIDEIDKADADVPNSLLEVLGNRSFQVAPLDDKAVTSADGRLPIVVITTNEERELPKAFVRRCAVLNLDPPSDEQGDRFVDWLLDRGRVHKHLQVARAAALAAAKQVLEDRRASKAAGGRPVGLAEYIDLLTALHELGDQPAVRETKGSEAASSREARQLGWLERIGVYGLVKDAGQNQDRASVRARSGVKGEAE